jgi:hypothetical protein
MSSVVIFTSAPALTAELQQEGNFDYTFSSAGVNNVISFSKDHNAISYEMTGTTRSNPPGGLFDKNSFRCVGTNSPLGGKTTGIAVCEAIDTDGDKRLTYFSVAADGKLMRETVTGTGKYDGMVASGKVEPYGPFSTIKAKTPTRTVWRWEIAGHVDCSPPELQEESTQSPKGHAEPATQVYRRNFIR